MERAEDREWDGETQAAQRHDLVEAPRRRDLAFGAPCADAEERDAGRAHGGRSARDQLTAFFTSATILACSAAVNSFTAKATGHNSPSSRFALSLKPSVAYRVLNFCALWKWQTTLPSFAYAGIPYHSFGSSAGALALMSAWSRLPRVRSGSRISASFASTA